MIVDAMILLLNRIDFWKESLEKVRKQKVNIAVMVASVSFTPME